MVPSAAEEGELRISDENEIRGNAAQKQCKITTRVLKSSTAARRMLNGALTSDAGTRAMSSCAGAGWGASCFWDPGAV